ncbi:hypothetical protein [Streptantibioticus ferralitis]|uniref:Uncharacterized protein n=1 Tax=Streptantibioticus ferralitis TaxID=236510 RepID=A0ABT5YX10_9ACTN|nr:hypothetical protein [Streptantibioticus ferralitis]MDF2255984.1 hypothetical protein [Streptantibioticus ferralitis]
MNRHTDRVLAALIGEPLSGPPGDQAGGNTAGHATATALHTEPTTSWDGR